MSEKLLPCPFCGGEAHIYTPPIILGDDERDVDWMAVRCGECGVSRGHSQFSDHNRQSVDFQRAKDEVTALWNNRRNRA